MMEGILRTHPALKRHCDVPLVEEREQFLRHLLRQGSSLPAVRTVAVHLLHVVRVMRLKTMREIRLTEVQEAAKRWAYYRGPHRMRLAGRYSTTFFVYVAKKWLRFHGKLKMPALPIHPFAFQLAVFRFLSEYWPAGIAVLHMRAGLLRVKQSAGHIPGVIRRRM